MVWFETATSHIERFLFQFASLFILKFDFESIERYEMQCDETKGRTKMEKITIKSGT